MNIELRLVETKDKPILKQLLEDYEKELLNSDSVEEYKYLDSYWEKSDRYPYFIEVDDRVAGFVLINNYNLVEKSAKNIAEFYIKKDFRKLGIGKNAATKAFEMFPGAWEVRELRSNVPAQNFWRKVIGGYTNGKYKEIDLNNEKWNGFVQTFNNISLE